MLSRKVAAMKAGRELFAFIKQALERSHVRIDQHVRNDDLRLQLRMFAHQSRVLMATDVVPGPPVEATLFYRRNVVRNQIVAQGVPLVDGAPQLAGSGLDSFPYAIANTGGIHFLEFSFWCALEHVRAMK